ncbi:MAG: hypothetical protein JST30_03490 [Armatimonadetes bacterium]|nr:hypothetical protein [Armatimonadota bacterium]
MLTTLIAAAAFAPGALPLGPFSGLRGRPAVPEDRRSWKQIDEYLEQVKEYEECLERLGLDSEEEEEWIEEQFEFYGVWSHRLQMKALPDGRIDPRRYKAAARHRALMPKIEGPAYAGTTWTFIGPRNLDGSQSVASGPVTGRVNGVEWDPSNPNTVWVGSASGGLCKSTDGGANFANGLSDGWDFTYTSDIEVDPTNSSRVYVATGDFQGKWGYGMGLMRSVNGGSSWTQELEAELAGCEIGDVMVDPDDPSVVLVAAGRGTGDSDGLGIWRSTDYGNTWTRVQSTTGEGYHRFAASIKVSGVRWIYAAHASSGVIRRSNDHGATWSDASPPAIGLTNVAASTTHRDRVYAYVSSGHIYRSADKGDTWSEISGNLGSLSGTDNDFRQTDYNSVLGCLNSQPDGSGNDILVLGMVDLFALQNAGSGSTWSLINDSGSGRLVHADQHGFDRHPALQNYALVGCDGGVWLMAYLNGVGWIFDNKNSTLRLTEHIGVSPHPDASTYPNYLLTGMWHIGSATSPNNVNDWNGVNSRDGMYCAIDQSNPNIQFTTAQNLREGDPPNIGFRATANGWAGSASLWTSPASMGESLPFITPIDSVPGVAGAVYFAGERLYRLLYNGIVTNWWKAVGGTFFNVEEKETATAVDAFASPNMGCYVGTNKGRLFGSTAPDSGLAVLKDFSAPITCVSTHPTVDEDALVCIGNGVVPGTESGLWECTNVFASNPVWVDRSGTGSASLPDTGVNWIVRDPYGPTSVWYAATDLGVFYTEDRGAHWYNATESLGLPNTAVNQLVVSDGYLYAGTWGRGIWRMQLFSTKPVVASFTIASTEVTGGNTFTGTLTLDREAPPGGLSVTVTSNTSAVPTQAFTVAAGRTTTSLPIDTLQTTADINATVTATVNGTSDSDTILVREVKVATMDLQNVTAGGNYLGTVHLDRAAPQGGATVNFADNDPTTTVTPQVTVPEGSTTAVFLVQTTCVPTNRTVSIQASRPGNGIQQSYTVYGITVTDVVVSPGSVWNTNYFAVWVTLNRPASNGGFPLAFESGNPNVVVLPATASVTEGYVYTVVVGETKPVATDTTVGIRVWDPYQGYYERSVEVKHLGIASLTFNPNPVIGGSGSTGTVTLDRKVGAEPVTIKLASGNPALVTLSASEVTIDNNGDKGVFGASTTPVSNKTSVDVSALLGKDVHSGQTVTTPLDLLPSLYIVAPTTATVNLGKVSSGSVANLAVEDGQALKVCKFVVPNQNASPVTVTLDATAPLTSCSALKLRARTKMTNSGVYTQTLELWNWNTSNWDTTDVRTDAMTTNYTTRDLVATGSLSRLLRPSDGALRSRYRVKQTGPSSTLLWCHENDLTVWHLTP